MINCIFANRNVLLSFMAKFIEHNFLLNEESYDYLHRFGNLFIVKYKLPSMTEAKLGVIRYSDGDSKEAFFNNMPITSYNGATITKYMLIDETNREKEIENYWNTHKSPFRFADDVPELPIVDEDKWNSFYVPKLIERGAIPIDKLVKGRWYYGNCRNATCAQWQGKEANCFLYTRIKFGSEFPQLINHFQTYTTSDVFVPIKELEGDYS